MTPDDLRRHLDALAEDAPVPVITPDMVRRAARRNASGLTGRRVLRGALGGAALVTGSLAVLVGSLVVLSPSSPVPVTPAAASPLAGGALASPAADAVSGPTPGSPPGVIGAPATLPATTRSSTGTPERTGSPGGATPTPTSASQAPALGTAAPVAVLLDAGGPGAGEVRADASYAGGTAYTLPVTIDTATAEDAAPAAVYGTVRFGAAFEYDLAGLPPGAAYRLRLHWAELDFPLPGDRVFDVSVNGRLVLDGVDVVAEAGGYRRVLIHELDVVADPDGRVRVAFSRGGPDNPFLSGLELLPS